MPATDETKALVVGPLGEPGGQPFEIAGKGSGEETDAMLGCLEMTRKPRLERTEVDPVGVGPQESERQTAV